jgi:hypothetical protein
MSTPPAPPISFLYEYAFVQCKWLTKPILLLISTIELVQSGHQIFLIYPQNSTFTATCSSGKICIRRKFLSEYFDRISVIDSFRLISAVSAIFIIFNINVHVVYRVVSNTFLRRGGGLGCSPNFLLISVTCTFLWRFRRFQGVDCFQLAEGMCVWCVGALSEHFV